MSVIADDARLRVGSLIIGVVLLGFLGSSLRNVGNPASRAEAAPTPRGDRPLSSAGPGRVSPLVPTP
ncbi:MAG: hypothetical protein ABIZ07_10740 [Dermatophilaceae bacterium]